jgi:hypothetical protein
MTEDFTDAKRDDAADLLDVVAKHRKRARSFVQPGGLPELFSLFAGWSAGRLASLPKESSFIKGLLVLGVVALLVDTAVWINRRASFGVEFGSRASFYAGALFGWSIVTGLGFAGDARQLLLALGFVVVCVLLGAHDKSPLLFVVAAVMLALAVAQLWPLVIGVPLYVGCLGAGFALMDRIMRGAKS